MFDPSTTHPSRELLQVFRSGTLSSPDEMDAISRHLDECPECLRTLENLTGDTLENLIERAYHGSETEPPLDIELSFLDAPQSSDELGRLGSYRILKVLGQGGMGMVFQAHDTQLERSVALKVIRPEAARKPEARERFFREAKLAASIEHDHIVPVFHAGEANGIPYMVMPFLKGMSLAERLKNTGSLPIAEVLRIGRQVALGLSVAHARGLIHRDIQPANLWIEPHHENRIRILDFGLARILEPEKTKLTQSGVILGTPAYMAPEQAQAKPVGPACDLFSLGVVLYQLATGRMPFEGDTVTSLLVAIVTQNPPPPHTINPEIPKPLSELIMELLDKDESKRPSSATYVADLLLGFAKSIGNQRETKPTPHKKSLLGKLTLALASLAVIFFAVATVFYVQTPKGTVRIELNDESLEATLTKNGAVIKGTEKNAEIRVETGEQSLKIKCGDFEFETDKFTLKKGEIITLKVELLTGKVQVVQNEKNIGERDLPKIDPPLLTVDPPKKKDPPPPARDYNREVAEWVLNMGGDVRIDTMDKATVERVGLPKNKFNVTSVSFSKRATIKDADLEKIGHCSKLDYLDLRSTDITDEGIVNLKNCLELRTLYLNRANITAKGLISLNHLQGLRTLGLSDTKVGDIELEELAKFPALDSIYLDGTNITNNGLQTVGKMLKVTQLDISRTAITDEGLNHLTEMRKLQTIFVRRTKATERGIEDLAKSLFKCSVIKTTTNEIAGRKVLWLKGEITLRNNMSEEVTIQDFKDWPKGENWYLLKINLPNNDLLDDVTMLDFADLRWLTGLRLYRAKLTETGIKEIATLTGLYELDLEGVAVKDSGMKHLNGLASLLGLNLSQTQITDVGLRELVKLTEVYELNIGLNKITDEGLKNIVALKRMKKLNLERTEVTDVGLKSLLGMEFLETLTLSSTKITDEGLKTIAGFKTLTKLNLEKTQVTEKGVAELKKAIPECEIITDKELPKDVPPPKKKDLPKPIAERAIAEWILSVGGSFEIHQGLGKSITKIDQLKDQSPRILSVTLPDNPEIKAADYAKFQWCRWLEIVNVTGSIDDEGLKNLKAPVLLKTSSAIRWLTFTKTKITDEGLVHLKDFQALTRIIFEDCTFTGEGLVHLKGCEKLSDLNFVNCKLDDKNLVHLKGCLSLEGISFQKGMITDVGFGHLCNCEKLTGLYLNETPIKDAYLRHLRRCKNLTKLFLSNTEITDEGLDNLTELSKLTELHVRKTKVTEKGVEKLQKALPSCTILLTTTDAYAAKWIDAFRFGDMVFEVGGKRVQHRKNEAMPKEEFKLIGIDVSNCKEFNDRWVPEIVGLKHLVTLDLFRTGLTTKGIQELENFPKLESLILEGLPVTDEGMKILKPFTLLKNLNLADTQITDKGLKELGGLSQLQKLNLGSNKITDNGLKELAGLKELQSLTLEKTQVTEKGVAELKKALPDCKIILE